MPYSNAHIYLRVMGHFGASASPVDYWSAGLRFAIVGADVPTSPGALQTFVDSCTTAFKTYHAVTSVGASTECFLTQLSAARVGPDGKYSPSTQLTVVNTFTPLPGGGTPMLPWSTAHVISLRTSIPRGYCSNGRFYYPAIAIGLSPGTGRMAPSVRNSINTAFKTCLDACNTAAAAYSTNMKCAVMSKVGPGLTALVTAIRADTRMDSVERRENKAAPDWGTPTAIA